MDPNIPGSVLGMFWAPLSQMIKLACLVKEYIRVRILRSMQGTWRWPDRSDKRELMLLKIEKLVSNV